MIKDDLFAELGQHDQFLQDRQMSPLFTGFKEGDFWHFAPTFKIKMCTNEYNPSRCPSWTDRIIYKGENFKLLNYDSNNFINMSDHRPVFA